ncbi:MAG: hypothetical protein IJK65_02290 [Clostridiales bacterium]|nr:hypothetical protein [Clostridiales bacterium]MBR4010911.1 hypothetical protein [Clostridiales bacterium]
MATEQGICKNCGSLLMVNSNDELCECVFCDCVFPSAEAIEIYKNPDGVEFPNLPQPKREAKAARHVVTPVFEDVVEKAVKVDTAQNKETKKIEKLFEISPDDIKTPKKVKMAVYITTAACILIILGISIPLSLIRTKHNTEMGENMAACIEKSGLSVSSDVEDGYAVGYKIFGQNNNKLELVSTKDVEKEQVVKAFDSFCEMRGEEYGYDADDGAHYYKNVVVTVYAPNGKFTIEGSKNGAGVDQVEFTEPEPEPAEEESESTK